jgi:hypothetical protein
MVTLKNNASSASSTGSASKVWPQQVMGGKYVRLLEKSMQGLRAEDEHGNRQLHLDDVFVAYLLAFFNPSVRSLRTMEDFSQTRQAQKHLSVSKICKSTLSDFNMLVDPKRLEPILKTLRDQLTAKQPGRPLPENDLQALLKHTVAVDGTFLHAVAEVRWAIANSNNHGTVRHRARLDARVNVSTWLPEAIVVPEPGQSEADSAIEHLIAGFLYLYDRGFMSFALIKAHHEETTSQAAPEAISFFVTRYKPEGGNSPILWDAVDSPLSEEDKAAGVVSDRVGYFSSEGGRRAGIANIPLREVIVPYEEKGEQKTLRLITNLFEVSAKNIALLYRSRWQVELFFRWFKSYGNFGHLISHQREGVLCHLYVSIIAILLMHLHTGFRPSKYMFALLGQVALGAATLDEILPILRERERQSELARQQKARKRAEKNEK